MKNPFRRRRERLYIMLIEKTAPPWWCAPYTPTWENGWIVVFPDQESAEDGLRVMSADPECPLLAARPHPGGGRQWYVETAH